MTTTEQSAPEAATFDADAWLAGATSTSRLVTLQQRPDLVGVAEDLTTRLRAAEAITEAGGDPEETPEALLEQMQAVHDQWQAGALRVRVEGRSDAARQAIRQGLPKRTREDEDEVTLHWLADAITEPVGLDAEFLRTLRERQQSQYQLLLLASVQVSNQPPGVLYAQARRGQEQRR